MLSLPRMGTLFPANLTYSLLVNNKHGVNMKPNKDPKSTDNKLSIPKPFLDQERGYTDDSLDAERGKTDDSLLDLRRKTEQDTDAKVSSDRRKADTTRTQMRITRDQKYSADIQVQNQRIVDDKSMRKERVQVDEAIEAERAIKDQILSEFLHQEREETDVNLSKERAQTDKVFLKSTNQLNEQVILHAKAKADVATRDELLAIVSHDLRNPIGSVLSCADMLLEDPAYAALGTDLKYWIELIKRNAETSLRLISDILDMERIAEGKLELRLRAHNISEIINESLQPFVHVAAANQIRLTSLPAEKNISVRFDLDRITQVLSNLIGNALKFTPKGGSVVVSVGQTEVESIISVTDTGPGIPEDQKEKIFVRYSQIGNKNRNGIGLGLFISKTLIESHNGRIWVTTPVEGGSVFHFSLPN